MMGTQLATTDHHLYLGVIRPRVETTYPAGDLQSSADPDFLTKEHVPMPTKSQTASLHLAGSPNLEYAASVWDPHHQKDINKLEKSSKKSC